MHYYVLLNADGTALRWCQTPTPVQSAPESFAWSDPTSALTWQAADTVTLIVPGTDVTLYPVQLPPGMRRARLQQAVPYALEEQLAGDIETCHFVIANKPVDGLWPVAVVAEDLMTQWLQPFQQAGIRVLALLPDFLAIPVIEGAWHIVLLADRAVCRSNDDAGFTVERPLLTTFLTLYLAQSKKTPQRIVVTGQESQPVVAALAEHITVPVLANETGEPLQALFTQGVVETPTLNLCQGQFQQKIPSNGFSRSLWSTGVLTALCLLVLIMGQSAQIVYFNQKNRTVDAEITKLYRLAYPQATRVVNVQGRIEQDLKAFTMLPQQGDLLSLLVEVGRALPKPVLGQIRRLQFTQQKLQLQMKFASFEQLNTVVKQWQENKLLVKQDQANSEGEGVVALITLSRNAQ